MTCDVQNTQQYHNAKPFELIAQRIIMHANNVQVIEDDDTPGRPDYQKSWFDFRTSDQLYKKASGSLFFSTSPKNLQFLFEAF